MSAVVKYGRPVSTGSATVSDEVRQTLCPCAAAIDAAVQDEASGIVSFNTPHWTAACLFIPMSSPERANALPMFAAKPADPEPTSAEAGTAGACEYRQPRTNPGQGTSRRRTRRRLGQCEIVGNGSYGIVFQAKLSTSNEDAAIKLPQPQRQRWTEHTEPGRGELPVRKQAAS